jgi:hypothetical protein
MSTSKRARTLGAFIDKVNGKYEVLHTAYEAQFWGTKMGLKGDNFSKEAENSTKIAMEALLRDPELLKETRQWKAEGEGTDDQKKCLEIFERTFSTYIMESKDALQMRENIMKLEGDLGEARNQMTLSYVAEDGKKEEGSSVKLRNTMRANKVGVQCTAECFVF